jgi:uncharacterized protein
VTAASGATMPAYPEVSASLSAARLARQAAALAARTGAGEINVAGVALVADTAGVLYWPQEHLLAVADLHLETASAHPARGVLLPPSDTASTLQRLGAVLARYAPHIVVALGDTFQDGDGFYRIKEGDRAMLLALQRARDWIWIAGSQDPGPALARRGASEARQFAGGVFARSLALGPLTFRHEPTPRLTVGEIAGHLHPAAKVHPRGRTLMRKCFAADARRVVMPAFGAYAGGLNIRDAAFLRVFGALSFTAHLLGEKRLYAFAAARCLAD